MQADPNAILPPLYTEPVWHYTSTQALIGIVTNGEFWATGSAHLNDSHEIRHGYNLAVDTWLKISDGYDGETDDFIHRAILRGFLHGTRGGAYVICASKHGNDLSQWRGYGSYAVEIDTRVPLDVRDLVPSDAFDSRYTPAWREVIYDEDEQVSVVHRVLATLAESLEGRGEYGYLAGINKAQAYATWFGWIDSLIPLLKDSGFKGEREVRYAVSYPEWHEGAKRHFRTGRYSAVPYLKVTRTDTPGRVPITAVRVGPTPYEDPATSGVYTLLHDQRYGRITDITDGAFETIPVYTSGIPYRA